MERLTKSSEISELLGTSRPAQPTRAAHETDADGQPANPVSGHPAPPSAERPHVAPGPVADHPTRPVADEEPESTGSHLAPVPDPGSPADRRSEVARWVVSLSEPLLSDVERARTTADMARFIERNSDWAAIYLTGVLHDLVHSLPEQDPWRHLGALIDLDQVASGTPTTKREKRLARKSETAPLPQRTGALTSEGRPFGTRRDAMDLISPGVDDVSTDEALAALATNLSPLSAALVAFGAHDARTLHFVIGQVYHHLWVAHFGSIIEETAGRALLDSISASIRWVMHRRRVYTGADDNFTHVVGFAWISKADRVNAGGDIRDEMGLSAQGAIAADEYHYLTGTEPDEEF